MGDAELGSVRNIYSRCRGVADSWLWPHADKQTTQREFAGTKVRNFDPPICAAGASGFFVTRTYSNLVKARLEINRIAVSQLLPLSRCLNGRRVHRDLVIETCARHTTIVENSSGNTGYRSLPSFRRHEGKKLVRHLHRHPKHWSLGDSVEIA